MIDKDIANRRINEITKQTMDEIYKDFHEKQKQRMPFIQALLDGKTVLETENGNQWGIASIYDILTYNPCHLRIKDNT